VGSKPGVVEAKAREYQVRVQSGLNCLNKQKEVGGTQKTGPSLHDNTGFLSHQVILPSHIGFRHDAILHGARADAMPAACS
jgi:hypothetical protein